MRYSTRILASLLLLAASAHAAPALVQVVVCTNATTGSDGKCTFPAPITTTAGNYLVWGVRFGGNGADRILGLNAGTGDDCSTHCGRVSTVNDAAGGGSTTYAETWQEWNIAGNIGVTPTCTVGDGGGTLSSVYFVCFLAEYSGNPTSNIFDVQNTSLTTSNTSVTGPAVTTTHTTGMITAFYNTNATTNIFGSAGGGFTKELTDTTGVMTFADKIVSSTGTYTPTMSSTLTDTWTSTTAAFDTGGGAPSTGGFLF